MKLRNTFLAFAAIGTAIMLPAAPAQASGFDSAETVQEATLSSFTKIYIAPVEVTLDEADFSLNSRRGRGRNNSGQRPITESDQDLKANDLHRALSRSFAKNFEIVDAPTADALTVSATITKLTPSRPTANEQSRGVGVQFGGSVSPGGASYSVVFTNNNQTLYTATESYRGNLTDGIPRIEIWYDTDVAFDRFAKKLSRYVRKN